MKPKCIVTVNGRPVAGVFWEKLIKITVADREGLKSDSIDIELEDGPPAFLEIPKEGDTIACWLGYEPGPIDHMGDFTVDDVDVNCWPWRMSIRGKASEMREAAKQHRRRHWDKKPFKDVAGEIAKAHGWSPQIDADIGSHQEPWWGQENESDIHFMERWAERLGGLFTVKAGRMIVARRGDGQTAGGGEMPILTITPEMTIKGSVKVHWGKREKHGKVRSEYHDTATGKREHVEEKSDPAFRGTYTHRHAFSSKAEAKRAARARARYLKAGGTRTSCAIEGNPGAKAGRPMDYAGMRPGVDGVVFIIEDATHTFSKGQGYRTELKAKLKPSGDDYGKAGGSPSGGSDASGGSSFNSGPTGATAPPAL